MIQHKIAVFVSAGPATADFPVVVTSYEIVIADSKLLQRYKWKYVVVDEGHRLKNFNCKLLRELRQIPVDNKLLLTGQLGSPAALGSCCCCLLGFTVRHGCTAAWPVPENVSL